MKKNKNKNNEIRVITTDRSHITIYKDFVTIITADSLSVEKIKK